MKAQKTHTVLTCRQLVVREVTHMTRKFISSIEFIYFLWSRSALKAAHTKAHLLVEEAAMIPNLPRGPSEAGSNNTTPYLLKANQELEIKRTTKEIKSRRTVEGRYS